MTYEILSDIDLFSGLGENDRRRLVAHGEEIDVLADETVFRHGDAADRVYAILDGRVVLYRDAVGKPVQLLARLGGGDTLGEMSLFGETLRSATAKAVDDCRLLSFRRDDLLALAEERPEFALKIQIAAARRRNQNAAAALDLGRHKELRIKVDAEGSLLRDGASTEVTVMDLSPGGLSISPPPPGWEPGQEVEIDIELGGERLRTPARVSWRSVDTIGLAFEGTSDVRDRAVWTMIHRLTDAPP